MSFLYDVTCYTYEKAVSTFGDELPTADQIGELKVECTWEWQKLLRLRHSSRSRLMAVRKYEK